MDLGQLLEILKARLGFTSSARDAILILAIESTICMLDDEKGIEMEGLNNPTINEFIVDYSAWKYESKGEMSGMPRHLDFALKNLMIHNGRVKDGV